MNWKYCLVNKSNENGDPIISLHFMFFDDCGKEFVSEKAVTVEAFNKNELTQHLFNMIRTLQSEDLTTLDEEELEVFD